ncbi:hypothetical protein EJ03DRAFT_375441 [Teratosphaeria nubilosa]|uniref:Uncharacterized protein n=1 Tax=Teratosphaeria nubilosa TaxID=161662 RepID=A0A6G1L720_9PEZI|nr:hypothetical protein EJ03DRAFT_375441 [Teratosphaeria nubilosa]
MIGHHHNDAHVAHPHDCRYQDALETYDQSSMDIPNATSLRSKSMQNTYHEGPCLSMKARHTFDHTSAVPASQAPCEWYTSSTEYGGLGRTHDGPGFSYDIFCQQGSYFVTASGQRTGWRPDYSSFGSSHMPSDGQSQLPGNASSFAPPESQVRGREATDWTEPINSYACSPLGAQRLYAAPEDSTLAQEASYPYPARVAQVEASPSFALDQQSKAPEAEVGDHTALATEGYNGYCSATTLRDERRRDPNILSSCWSTSTLAKSGLIARGTLKDTGSLKRRGATLRHQFATAGKTHFRDRQFSLRRYRKEGRIQPVTDYGVSGYAPCGKLEVEKKPPTLLSLAKGVMHWPETQDAGLLTQVVQAVKINEHVLEHAQKYTT